MKWVEAQFLPTALFSLKPSWATSSGGKTLLVPTPYSFKMALLDAAIRTKGIAQAEPYWSWIRALQFAVKLPADLVVSNVFARILRQRKNPAKPGDPDFGPYQRTIGYREYLSMQTPYCFAFGLESAHIALLTELLPHVTYCGKRGSFMQLQAMPTVTDEIAGYTLLTAAQTTFTVGGTLQVLDDCDAKTTFEQVNIYAKKKPKRIQRQIVLPVQLHRSSKSYSWYKRIESP